MTLSPIEIKENIIQSVDPEGNVQNMRMVCDMVTLLERQSLSTEDLEVTRLGRIINLIRRQTTDVELSRRTKHLIKKWQRLVKGNLGPSHQENNSPPLCRISSKNGLDSSSPALGSSSVTTKAVATGRGVKRKAEEPAPRCELLQDPSSEDSSRMSWFDEGSVMDSSSCMSTVVPITSLNNLAHTPAPTILVCSFPNSTVSVGDGCSGDDDGLIPKLRPKDKRELPEPEPEDLTLSRQPPDCSADPADVDAQIDGITGCFEDGQFYYWTDEVPKSSCTLVIYPYTCLE